MKTSAPWVVGGMALLSTLGYLVWWIQEPVGPPPRFESAQVPAREDAWVKGTRAVDGTPPVPPISAVGPLGGEGTAGFQKPNVAESTVPSPPLEPGEHAMATSPTDIGPAPDVDDPSAGIVDAPVVNPINIGPPLDADDPSAGIVDAPVVSPVNIGPPLDADDPGAGVIDAPVVSSVNIGLPLNADDPGAGVIDALVVNPVNIGPPLNADATKR